MPHLVVRAHGCVSYSLPLEGPLRAGREKDNDLAIPDARISRYHLEFVPHGDTFVVQDLRSTHGMLVNGTKTDRHPLVDGDVIQFGSALLTYRAHEDPGTTLEFERTDPSMIPPSDRAEQRLQLLCRIGETVGSTRDSETFVHQMVVVLRDVLGCERAIVGLGESVRDGIRKIARSDKPGDDVVVSRSILEAVLGRRQQAVFIEKVDGKAPPTMNRKRIRADTCVPILAGARLFGFLYVDDSRNTHRFTPEDVQFLIALAHLAGGVLEGVDRLHQADERIAALDRCEIIGKSPVIEKLRQDIFKCAPTAASVFIHGESGTGKELVARAVHALSGRKSNLFVAVNCAAIPTELIESELFGYVKGAFTSAKEDKPGKFVLADGGTLFLDEIGDLSLPAQAKVLRAIQEGEVDPLGAKRPLKVNVRIVTATHKDLRKEITDKRFREDLFYRLHKAPLEVPPLRDREGDVELLARTLLPRLSASVGKRFSGTTPEALEVLRSYSWPGNVRELLNVLESAVIFSESSTIDVGDLGDLVPRVEA